MRDPAPNNLIKILEEFEHCPDCSPLEDEPAAKKVETTKMPKLVIQNHWCLTQMITFITAANAFAFATDGYHKSAIFLVILNSIIVSSLNKYRLQKEHPNAKIVTGKLCKFSSVKLFYQKTVDKFRQK